MHGAIMVQMSCRLYGVVLLFPNCTTHVVLPLIQHVSAIHFLKVIIKLSTGKCSMATIQDWNIANYM